MVKKKPVGFTGLYPVSEKFETKIEKIDFFAGLVTYGELIIKQSSSASGAVVVYTVPQGYTLFLNSACLTIDPDSAASSAIAIMDIDDNQKQIIVIFTEPTSPPQTIALNFQIPLRINSGSTVNIETNNLLDAYGNFTGYLVPNSTLPFFT